MSEVNTSETEKLAGTINRALGCGWWVLWMAFCFLMLAWIVGLHLAVFIMGLVFALLILYLLAIKLFK